jgi:hypothetical protein
MAPMLSSRWLGQNAVIVTDAHKTDEFLRYYAPASGRRQKVEPINSGVATWLEHAAA